MTDRTPTKTTNLDLFAGIPVADRGLTPVEQETDANGVRKTTYHDGDGNKIGFGGGPV